MAGHGSPRTSPGPVWLRAAAPCRSAWCALTLVICLAAEGLAADDLRVRIAWGGGAERLWRGTVAVSEGTLSEPRPLGVEADEPGSMWLDGDSHGDGRKLVIHQRSPRAYDGVDLLVAAPPSARLVVQLAAADESKSPEAIEIPLGDLSGEFVSKELDGRGNRLLAVRSPGDQLRVSFARESLVFAPGEVFKLALRPHALPLGDNGRARIKVQLISVGSGRESWSQQHEVQAGREEDIPLEVPLPGEEGVYDVAISAVNSPNWSQAVRRPLNWKKTLAERRVQLLVLGTQRPPAARSDREFTQVLEIDPANPRWFELLAKLPQLQQLPLLKPRIPRLWKGPLGNGCMQTRRHALGEVVQLSPNADSPDVSWEAYSLPIAQPGRPHILEVDYPSDVPQTLGISIVEPNAAGALTPIGLDSGVDTGADGIGSGGSPRWQRHRLIFWPRTDMPLVLITNGRERSPAVYGKIRVLAGGERLPRLLPDRAAPGRRLLAAYFDRPLIPENFSANECLDPWSGRSLDDWWTFYEGGTRLVEYLNHTGYNGLMLGVLADGSTIYPSALLEPTPRYDTGAFFASAQDPVRKDVLEMLLRLFDRENLQLIPTVEFAAPLPELEAIRRGGGPEAQAIEWIGADGAGWPAAGTSQRGLAPYYNMLNPRVQQAMLGVLRELIGRYAQHPSFAGVAIRLSADGYAQLPGPDWGLDDATIAQFERDARLQVPGKGPQRFAERSAFLAQESHRRPWLEWRAAQLGKLYRRAAEELTAIRPRSRLYLAGAGMIGGPELEAELRPALPRRTTLAESLLRVGIDARHYQDEQQHVVLLRPERIAPQGNLGARAVDLEIGQMSDIDRCFQPLATPGSLFFHQPREVRIESFDQKSPWKPGYTWLVSQPTPSGQQNRRRFVHSLATLDSQVMVDGGWLLPLGQEDALRDLTAAYRSLPAVRFQPVGNRQSNDAAQPVTFRWGVHGGRTYLYAVNDAPFAITARVHVESAAACRVEELTGKRKVSPLQPEVESGSYWEVRLEPYDLVAVQFSEPSVQFSSPHVAWPGTVEATLGTQIRKLGARAAALRNPPPLDVLVNAGFERPAAPDGQIPEWAVTNCAGATIRLDKSQKHGGNQSVKIRSDKPVACLVSRPFSSPATGRLSMSVWLRVADAGRQPPLRLALEAKLNGRDYYRFAPVGLPPGSGQPSVPIMPEWGQYVFQVDDLPLDGLTSLRVRFDLMGPGEVWVDDVQIFGLAFSRPELVELSKLITLADVKLQNGQIGDCLHLLEGYWPRFLEENVALQPGMLPGGPPADGLATKPPAAEEKPPERSGLLNRMKDMLPESLRF